MVAVGDDWHDIESVLDHDAHHVPGFIHLASIDAFDGQHVEY